MNSALRLDLQDLSPSAVVIGNDTFRLTSSLRTPIRIHDLLEAQLSLAKVGDSAKKN